MQTDWLSGTIAVGLLSLTACAVQEPVATRLDSSGLTIVTLREPVVLARPVPGLASSARDYAYVGPVEVNNMGKRDYYLWIGMASTVDREIAYTLPASADSVVLLVDGQPMTLTLADWPVRLDRPPYDAAVPFYARFAARASLHQIRRISEAESVDMHVIADTGTSMRYRLWEGGWRSMSLLAHAE